MDNINNTTKANPTMTDKNIIDRHAHNRITELRKDVKSIEIRTTANEDWQSKKDDDLKTIKNWFIGAVGLGAVQTFGLWEMVQKWLF